MDKVKSSFFKTVKLYTIILFTLFSLSFLFINYSNQYIHYKQEAKFLRDSHLIKIKENLKWEVKHYINQINDLKRSLEKTKRFMIKNRVEQIHFIAKEFYQKYKDTKSQDEIKSLILTAIRNIKFPNSGYYFIFDLNGNSILHESEKIVNRNHYNLKDIDNKYILQDMISLAKSKKEGFYTYKWGKPNEIAKDKEKISYVKLLESFGWIIGTGIYKNDLDRQVKKEILNNHEQMKFDDKNDNYVFIANWQGVSLSYPAKGKNMYMTQDKHGVYLVQELIKLAKADGGFLKYVMPSLDNERNINKISYVEGIKEWQWYVGAGIYVDDIEEEILVLEKNKFNNAMDTMFYTLILFFLVVFTFIYVNKRLHAKIDNDVTVFIDFFNTLAHKNIKINLDELKFQEFENLAINANKMLEDKVKLEDYLEKYKKIVSSSKDLLALVDINFRYQAANETYLQYFCKTKEELIGQNVGKVLGQDNYNLYIKPYLEKTFKGSEVSFKEWIDFANGRKYMHVQYFPYKNNINNKVEYIVICARDITEQKIADDQLHIWEKVFSNTGEAVMICDKDKNIINVNHSFSTITKYEKNEIIGKKSIFFSNELADKCYLVDQSGSWSGEIKSKDKFGKEYPALFTINVLKDEDSNIVNYISVFSDISYLKESEKKLEYLAHHDSLTNLPNRVLLNDRIGHAINNAKRDSSVIAVCFIDLDNFKKINDSFGHSYGDDVLKQVANRIQKLLREVDTLSRIGGDEFILLLEHLKDINEVTTIINKIQNTFDEPFISKNQKFFITASIGISFYPQTGLNEEELIKNADTAMYQAKDAGKNTYKYYTDDMSISTYELIDIENSLKEAIDNEEFLVYYQPQIDLNTHEVIGAEALVRWNHPQKGILTPMNFIPLAEDTKMIISIGEFVLYQACLDFKKLQEKYPFMKKVAINVSGVQIEHSDFLKTLQNVIKKTELNPNSICLEITESVIMNDPHKWISLLDSIKSIGINLAIDDFGTGYSSLSYLRKLPIDKLKIDMSFVKDIPNQEDACAIAKSIINLSNSMKMSTLAEGIETIEQEEHLRENGCEEGQGYLFSKPISLEEFDKWVSERKLPN